MATLSKHRQVFRPQRVLCLLTSLAIVSLGTSDRYWLFPCLTALLGYGLFFATLTPMRPYLKSYAYFLFVLLVQNNWIATPYYHGTGIYIGYFLINAILAAPFALLGKLYTSSRLSHRLKPYFLGAVAVFAEYFRQFFFSGYPFNLIGEALFYHTYAIQVVNLLGVYGATFLVTATNTYFALFLQPRLQGKISRQEQLRRPSYTVLMGWLLLASFPMVYGAVWARGLPSATHHSSRVALVQTGLLAEEKHNFPEKKVKAMPALKQWRNVIDLIDQEYAKDPRPLDLIVLPESVLPFFAYEKRYTMKAVIQALCGEGGLDLDSMPPLDREESEAEDEPLAKVSNLFLACWLSNHYNCDLLLGLVDEEEEGSGVYNAAFLVQPNERQSQRHIKSKLVPFAEYLPMKWMNSFIARFGIDACFLPGSGITPLMGKQRYLPSICIEEGDNSLMRDRGTKTSTLFVNMTNDVWFPNSRLPLVHLNMGRLRAIENGLPLLRACNTGVTAAIDVTGKVLVELPLLDENRDLFKGVLIEEIPLEHRPTPFRYFGNRLILAISFLALFLGLFRIQKLEVKLKKRVRKTQ